MNSLESFFLKYIAPYTPFGATNFYPCSRGDVTATSQTPARNGGVHFQPDTNTFEVFDGATVIFYVGGGVVEVSDDCGRGDTPSARIKVDEIEYLVDPKSPFLIFTHGIFELLSQRERRRRE